MSLGPPAPMILSCSSKPQRNASRALTEEAIFPWRRKQRGAFHSSRTEHQRSGASRLVGAPVIPEGFRPTACMVVRSASPGLLR